MTAAQFDLDREVAAMHADATARTGLSDFGPEDYRQGFDRLAAHLAAKDLTDAGRNYIRGDLVGALVGRLVREDQWKKHPEYKSREIPKPLVICGIPRTGTTALHKVMALDPQFQGLDHWLASWPMPRPARNQWENEPGFRNAQVNLENLFELVPSLRLVHEMVADEVDECLEVLRLDFVSNRYPSSYDMPDYDAWFQAQDETPFYRRMADTYRLIGLNDDRKWLLKNPGHVAELEALLAVFPDAQVVVTHRDPVKSIPSLTSLLSGLRQVGYSDADLTKLGRRELAYWTKAQASAKEVRSRHRADQFLDVDHRDFHADPIGAVRRIYDHFGLELSDDVAQSMRDWLAANPADKHGGHSYDLADYGLSEARIRDAMGEG